MCLDEMKIKNRIPSILMNFLSSPYLDIAFASIHPSRFKLFFATLWFLRNSAEGMVYA